MQIAEVFVDLAAWLIAEAHKLDVQTAENDYGGYSTAMNETLLKLAHEMRVKAMRCREVAGDCVVT